MMPFLVRRHVGVSLLLLVVLLMAGGSRPGFGQATPVDPLFLPLIANPACLQRLELVDVEVDRCSPLGSSSGIARGDFNGDGFADLAIGVPGEDLTLSSGFHVPDAGAVNIIYGSSRGLAASAGPGDQLWSQDSPNVEGDPEPYDFFGSALASGDFNGDRFSDLAIGAPGEDIGSISNAGAVNVLYGGPGGLTAANDQLWQQGASSFRLLGDAPEAGDNFGVALAWGDFNRDSFGDLAIGARLEDLTIPGTTIPDAGALHIIYGSSSGLSVNAGPGDQFWTQSFLSIGDPAEAGDLFASALTGGDFNIDGFTDLAIGVPFEDVIDARARTMRNAGAVVIIYGSSGGLLANAGPGNQRWTQNDISSNTPGENDQFGAALVAADFDGNRAADLAVGAPRDYAGPFPEGGVVYVIYGASAGLAAFGSQFFHQDTNAHGLEVEDKAETSDHFGAALAAGDFNGDGFRDLAVGVPHEDREAFQFPSFLDAGGVNLIFGSSQRLRGFAPFFRREYELSFGHTLSSWDFNGDRVADLAIGGGESDGVGGRALWPGAEQRRPRGDAPAVDAG